MGSCNISLWIYFILTSRSVYKKVCEKQILFIHFFNFKWTRPSSQPPLGRWLVIYKQALIIKGNYLYHSIILFVLKRDWIFLKWYFPDVFYYSVSQSSHALTFSSNAVYTYFVITIWCCQKSNILISLMSGIIRHGSSLKKNSQVIEGFLKKELSIFCV